METSETRPNNTLWRHGEDLVLWEDGTWKWLIGNRPHGTVDESRLERVPWKFDCVWHPEHGSRSVRLCTAFDVTLPGRGVAHLIPVVDWPGEWRLVDDVIREQREEIERLRTEAARNIGSTAALKMRCKTEYEANCHLGQQLLSIRRKVREFNASYGEEIEAEDPTYLAARCEKSEQTIAAIDAIAAFSGVPETVVTAEEQAATIAEQAAEIERLKTASASVETARESLDQSIVDEQAARIRELEKKIEQLKQKPQPQSETPTTTKPDQSVHLADKLLRISRETKAFRDQHGQSDIPNEDDSELADRCRHLERTLTAIDQIAGKIEVPTHLVALEWQSARVEALEAEVERLKIAAADVEDANNLDQSIDNEQTSMIEALESRIEELKETHQNELERLYRARRSDTRVIARMAREIWGGGDA